ncbi:hypothetical protein Tco_1071446 [Tanacetum coccineum]
MPCSDTRTTLLDRTDFASWQQRIRLYCRGKENGVNILKSIDEGPFQMGTFRETLAEGNEGPYHLGARTTRVYSDLSPKIRKAVKLNRGLRDSNYVTVCYFNQHEPPPMRTNDCGSIHSTHYDLLSLDV